MKITYLVVAISLCLSLVSNAQNSAESADNLVKMAQTNYDRKDFTQARYLFKQAYGAYAAKEDYKKAVACGLQVSALYHREFFYKEAFEMCGVMDQLVSAGEAKQQKRYVGLHFAITKERFDMYLKLRNAVQANTQLGYLEQIANQAGGEALNDELLYSKAFYYYAFGHQAEGDASFDQLIAQYKKKKDYARVSDCYRKLISIAQTANNAALMGRTYEELIKWNDKAKSLTAQDELSVLKRKYDGALETLQEREGSLSAKQYIIVGLTIVVVILGVALALLGLLLMRFMATSAKQKKSIQIANEHNELKSQFICNISAQLDPTLDRLTESALRLPSSNGMIEQIEALRSFSNHIQELSTLENSLTESFEMATVNNIGRFCEGLMEELKTKVQPNVVVATNVPNIPLKTNTEQLGRLLNHLLNNAALYTTEGKITLEFMKRGAHTFQFIISDTGAGIPVEMRDNLFKPFTQIGDLTLGDRLGLPICELIAIKLNGNLSLDTTYTKGTRFILKLNA